MLKYSLYIMAMSLLVGSISFATTKSALTPISNSELLHLKVPLKNALKNLSDGDFDIFGDQAFWIEGSDGAKAGMIPVGYRPKKKLENGGTALCAIAFFLKSSEKFNVLEIVGVGNTETVTCIHPLAVGLIDMVNTSIVRIALVFEASSPNAIVKVPIIISGNLKTNKFEFDEKLSTELDSKGTASSIREIKKYLNDKTTFGP